MSVVGSTRMLKLLIITILIAGVITAGKNSKWEAFKAKHGKIYGREADKLRRSIWEENLEKIEIHNTLYEKGLVTFYLGENEFADMTTAEFVKTRNGFKGPAITSLPKMKTPLNSSLPNEVNWIKKGYVTGVKDQGPCGSCWAFSATGSLEGAHFKKTGRLVSLSEKNLMDCSTGYGNEGCEGGLMDLAFQYVIDNKGLDTEESYPYKPEDGLSCDFKRAGVGTTETSFTDITRGSEEELQHVVATVGPVSVAIDASQFTFQLYSGGVYDEPNCNSMWLDHGVLVVGYGVLKGNDYYLVKNSWGTRWGHKGYILMSRNKDNQCGIASLASYPTV